jgi:hypothetical protein
MCSARSCVCARACSCFKSRDESSSQYTRPYLPPLFICDVHAGRACRLVHMQCVHDSRNFAVPEGMRRFTYHHVTWHATLYIPPCHLACDASHTTMSLGMRRFTYHHVTWHATLYIPPCHLACDALHTTMSLGCLVSKFTCKRQRTQPAQRFGSKQRFDVAVHTAITALPCSGWHHITSLRLLVSANAAHAAPSIWHVNRRLLSHVAQRRHCFPHECHAYWQYARERAVGAHVDVGAHGRWHRPRL